ncbi:sulfatase family protein [Algoriphagus sp.]|uniref:sulfatase family protein n=1 Tax=Algoriphagus sp. TaxID=1872435 RepID=UPI003F718796
MMVLFHLFLRLGKLQIFGLLWTASITLACAQKPNILFIYSDDQAYWTLGVSGNGQAHSPHLDRLASQGAFFENAFVTTPVCSPSRVSLMTGQYASEYGVLDFIAQPGHMLYDPENLIGLDPESITFPEVFSQAGYHNGLVGKWHLGDWTEKDSDQRYHPTNQGYEYFMGITGGGESPIDPRLEEDGIVKEFDGLTVDILTDRALKFLENNQERSFLLSVHYRSPHSKWLPVADEDWAPYEDKDMQVPHPDYPDLDIEKVKSRMKEYMASSSGVDRSVGKLLKQLEELGLSENTIVIFTSDHGYNMGHNGIEHKGNGNWITKQDHPATENLAKNSRPNLYDQSLHVPVIIRWPGVIKPGLRVKETFSNLDWYPTVLEMAGIPIPIGKVLRGNSIVPILKDEAEKGWGNDLYAEYSMINYSTALMRSYRTPEWKLIKDFQDPSRDELYHLMVDPEERNNLMTQNSPEIELVVKRLTEKIYNKMKEIEDPLVALIPTQ